MTALPASRGPRCLEQPQWRCCVALLAACILIPAVAAGANSADEVRIYVEGLGATLPDSARTTLSKVDGVRRRVLALRSYVRVGEELSPSWSWTEQQVREFEGSEQQRRLLTSIATVTARFEAENPGYTLFTNTQVRSLELQLERWNANPRVAKVADELYAAVRRELIQQRYPQRPDATALERCKAFLIAWHPSVAAPLAAPGLSAHGQLRAIDFQVVKGQQIIAGTSITAIAREWVRSGWARNLQRAVGTSDSGFTGPLQSPNEPWHYRYER